MNMEGSVDIASTSYIIRDFEEKDFKARKQLMLDIAEEMNANFDTPRVIVHLHDQYYNMKKIIEKDMTPINIAKEVMENLGIKPLIEPVRGDRWSRRFLSWAFQRQISSQVVKACMAVSNSLKSWNHGNKLLTSSLELLLLNKI